MLTRYSQWLSHNGTPEMIQLSDGDWTPYDAAAEEIRRKDEALELIIRRVALVSPYYEIARAALSPVAADAEGRELKPAQMTCKNCGRTLVERPWAGPQFRWKHDHESNHGYFCDNEHQRFAEPAKETQVEPDATGEPR